MIPKSKLVTIHQATILKQLGYNEICARNAFQFWSKGPYMLVNSQDKSCNHNEYAYRLSVPTVDEAIDWIRRKYSIMVYGMPPFVDPIYKKIIYSFKLKRCNIKWGYNQREHLGGTGQSKNQYAAKRKAITIALRYIQQNVKLTSRLSTS